jgi:hypothetical protein
MAPFVQVSSPQPNAKQKNDKNNNNYYQNIPNSIVTEEVSSS